MIVRKLAVLLLALLGCGVLALMGYLAHALATVGEAAGWLTAGFLSLREVVSKIENVTLRVDASGKPDDPVHTVEETR